MGKYPIPCLDKHCTNSISITKAAKTKNVGLSTHVGRGR